MEADTNRHTMTTELVTGPTSSRTLMAQDTIHTAHTVQILTSMEEEVTIVGAIHAGQIDKKIARAWACTLSKEEVQTPTTEDQAETKEASQATSRATGP